MYGREYLVDKKGNPIYCFDCISDQRPKPRKTRARYKCIECGWCMCRKHAIKHFKPATCNKE